MKLGAHPVLFEAGQFGGRLRSQAFEGAKGVIAELGGMRFPVSSTGFYHYVDLLGIKSAPFPNPLTSAAGSTVIDLLGQTHYAETLDDLPPLFREVANAYDAALEDIEKSIELEPKSAGAWYVRGAIAEARGNHGGARGFYMTALGLDPENQAYKDKILGRDTR